VKIGIAVGVVMVILALVVCLVPLKTVAYDVTVNYEDVETYYEDEPYQVTENYSEDVPLSFEAYAYIDEDVTYEHHQIIIGDIVFQDEIVEVTIYVACVAVRNTDDVSGDFTVSFSGFEPMFGEISLTRPLTLDPGGLETAECPAESSIDDWSYEVTPGTKQVESERTVTKYRQVQKQRTVMKQRPETRYKKVTLLDYLVHY
jgi:hypothetical protein